MAFHVLCHPLIQQWAHVLPSLPFAAYRPAEALLVTFTFFARCNSRCALALQLLPYTLGQCLCICTKNFSHV